MAVEIERKFLVNGNSWRAGVSAVRRIRQAYLAENARVSIRIRIDGDTAATLTIKSAEPGVERSEFEYAIPVADAKEMMERRDGAVVVKSRHIVKIGVHMWEIDEFEGGNEGLVLAEIELDRAHTSFERPLWLGEEVTHDPRYYNAELAKSPHTRWRDAHVSHSIGAAPVSTLPAPI